MLWAPRAAVQKLSEVMKAGVCSDACVCFVPRTGAGVDGVEEIKRHPFFVTIDWNVSRSPQGTRVTRGWGAGRTSLVQTRGAVALSPGRAALSGAFGAAWHFTGTDRGPPCCGTGPASPLML